MKIIKNNPPLALDATNKFKADSSKRDSNS